ncbi:hypothetical protein DSO57_1012193 [Entomophthora muscae]|uniref:Uncharacterized protein n=1 Tax=Entomophthora muscae TaxID=34485 RepID=A0ACC2UFD6_9FUNG|nr:hypothetical protein DSO57_1012193 [Entomophthora muscae]
MPPSPSITIATQGSFSASNPLVLKGHGVSGWVQYHHRFTEYHKALLTTKAFSNGRNYKRNTIGTSIAPYYVFSGPQPTGLKLVCLKSTVCLVKLIWNNSTWAMEMTEYPSHMSRRSRHTIPNTIRANWTEASYYFLKAHGPSTFRIVFNQISLCRQNATAKHLCAMCRDIKVSCHCGDLYLPSGAPDGIAGLEKV